MHPTVSGYITFGKDISKDISIFLFLSLDR